MLTLVNQVILLAGAAGRALVVDDLLEEIHGVCVGYARVCA